MLTVLFSSLYVSVGKLKKYLYQILRLERVGKCLQVALIFQPRYYYYLFICIFFPSFGGAIPPNEGREKERRRNPFTAM